MSLELYNKSLSEFDQILVPISATQYRAYSVLEVLGIKKSTLTSTSGFGMPPVQFITQRSPYQSGETPLDMRYNVRTIQIVVSDSVFNRVMLYDRHYELMNLLRPSRSINSDILPLIYRKHLPSGDWFYANDLETEVGTQITSQLGGFIHHGLKRGSRFEILSGADAGVKTVTGVSNDSTATLSAALTAAATNVAYRYKRAQSYRDLYCVLESGPAFDSGVDITRDRPGYTEALRFVAHDPFWYGEQQSVSMTPNGIGALIFDGFGAWFDVYGEWLFDITGTGDAAYIGYWGHEPAFPVISLTGPATDAGMIISPANALIFFNYSVAAGETVTIDTENVTVSNNLGVNLFSYLTGDIASFAILPEPQAYNKLNTITISYSDGVVGQSNVSVTWKNKYLGT